nr:hypothetical protein [Propioniciclava sp. MC1683]
MSPMPALLTRMSRRPYFSTEGGSGTRASSLGDGGGPVLLARDVEAHVGGVATAVTDAEGDLLAELVLDVGDHHVGALLGEALAGELADAGGATGDEGDAVGETKVHVLLLCEDPTGVFRRVLDPRSGIHRSHLYRLQSVGVEILDD